MSTDNGSFRGYVGYALRYHTLCCNKSGNRHRQCNENECGSDGNKGSGGSVKKFCNAFTVLTVWCNRKNNSCE